MLKIRDMMRPYHDSVYSCEGPERTTSTKKLPHLAYKNTKIKNLTFKTMRSCTRTNDGN